MSFQSEYKITAADRQDKGVTGLPDTPNMPTTVIQERFDSLGNLAIDKFNALVDGASDSVDGSDTKFPTNKAIVDYISGEGGAIIDDNTPSTHKTYSSSKVENMYAAIPGNLINDTTPSSSTVYSGNKVENMFAGVSSRVINDTTPSNSTAYSGNKIENMFANVSDRIIDDSTPSSSKTYSSEEIEQKIADIPTPESFIDDDNVSTETTFSSRKISDNYIGFAETEEQTATDEFSTINGGLLSECKVALSPIQDLHGYAEPWVGGAGKNKLPLTVDGIKALNTTGTWSGNVYTINGGTITIDTDVDGNVIDIKANGTFTARTVLHITKETNNYHPTSGSYIVNKSYQNTYTTLIVDAYNNNTWVQSLARSSSVDDVQFTLDYSGYDRLSIYLEILSGISANNIIFKPMIRLATESDPTFEPYSNICPISGHTQVDVDVSDGQTTQEQITVNLGGTYYSGILDVVTGVLTATQKSIGASDFDTFGQLSEGGLYYVQTDTTGSKQNGNGICNVAKIDNQNAWISTTPVVQISPAQAGRIRFYCESTSMEEFQSQYTSLQIVFELATPTPIQLSPTMVKALVGENHLSAPLDGQEITESKYRYLFTWDIVEDELNKLSDSIDEVSDDLSDRIDDVSDSLGDRIDDVEETLNKTHYSSAVSCAIDDTTCTIADANITTSSLIEPFYSNTSGDNVVIKNQTVTTGQVVLTFDALLEATSFSVRITNL